MQENNLNILPGISALCVKDTRLIIDAIYDNFGFDLSDLAQNSLRFRIGQYLQKHHIKSVSSLVSLLADDEYNFDQFLASITIGSSEMFRDPPLWQLLRINLLPGLFVEQGTIITWFPRNVSGDELFSFLIVISELGFLKKMAVYASTLSYESIRIIKSGFFEKSKFSISKENYQNSGGIKEFLNYFEIRNSIYYRNTSLIRNVTFTRQNNLMSDHPSNVDLVLLRNQLLYFNPNLRNMLLSHVTDAIKPGGYLILGNKENLAGFNGASSFVCINQCEKIFQKKI